MKKFIFVSLVALAFQAGASLITFDLRDTGATAEIESGIILRDGLTATLIPNDGSLNQTSSAFGINAAATGDDTDEIDNGSGISEFITITFSQPVLFTQLVLSSFPSSHLADLTVQGYATQTLVGQSSATDIYDFTSNHDVPLGNSVVVEQNSGSVFSLDAFTVSTIPEPSSLLLLSLGGLALIRRRR